MGFFRNAFQWADVFGFGSSSVGNIRKKRMSTLPKTQLPLKTKAFYGESRRAEFLF
jgi:hypothetical protein